MSEVECENSSRKISWEPRLLSIPKSSYHYLFWLNREKVKNYRTWYIPERLTSILYLTQKKDCINKWVEQYLNLFQWMRNSVLFYSRMSLFMKRIVKEDIIAKGEGQTTLHRNVIKSCLRSKLPHTYSGSWSGKTCFE